VAACCWCVCFCRALKARAELCSFFLQGCADARQQLAAGHEVPGILGRLVAAVDEQGNRCALLQCFCIRHGLPYVAGLMWLDSTLAVYEHHQLQAVYELSTTCVFG
jgi:hypothetical protein